MDKDTGVDESINIACAEKIMGWRRGRRLPRDTRKKNEREWRYKSVPPGYSTMAAGAYFSPSSSVNDAWVVAESVLCEKGGSVYIKRGFEIEPARGPSGYWVMIGNKEAWGQELPRAMSIACLLAMNKSWYVEKKDKNR